MSVEDNYGGAGTKDVFSPLLAGMWSLVIATTWTVCSEIMRPNGTFHTMLLAKVALIIVQNSSQNLGCCSTKQAQRPEDRQINLFQPVNHTSRRGKKLCANTGYIKQVQKSLQEVSGHLLGKYMMI